jgi:hypothetical protein
MLLYSWNKVLNKAKTMTDVIVIMYSLTWPQALRLKAHKNLQKFHGVDFSGNCFLLDPISLLNNPSFSKEDIVEYISLASKRNLANYLLTGETTLDSRLAKTPPTKNKLLTVNENNISFAYEQGKQ